MVPAIEKKRKRAEEVYDLMETDDPISRVLRSEASRLQTRCRVKGHEKSLGPLIFESLCVLSIH
jgi:hypothetical protein